MTVSVVIPTFNRGHCVAEAVDSALAQSYTDLEVIVVDDGSTDGTSDRIAGFTDPRVRYVSGRHSGVSAARNLGVANAKGDVVAFLDSDDLWRPDKIAREMAFLAAHPQVDAVFSDLEKRDEAGTVGSFMRQTAVFSRRLAGVSFPDGVAFERREMFLVLLEEVPIKPSALSLRRVAFEALGGFDETWSSSEDWEFLLRFARRYRFGYVDLPLAVLRISDDSLHIVDQVRGERAMIRLMARERAALRDDPQARATVHRGLVQRIKHFAWHYQDSGRLHDATRVYWEGVRLTGDPGLLARGLRLSLRQLARRVAR